MESKEQRYKRLQEKLIQSEKDLERDELYLRIEKRKRIKAEKLFDNKKNPEFTNHYSRRLDLLISKQIILNPDVYLKKLNELRNEIILSITHHFEIQKSEDVIIKSVNSIING
ncbi:hypothetical protein ACKGJY_14505 [Hyunsoonleella sp. 2307UL5-6]|uniref:hypothetical protein n=1 Tax=Hyunsoonleella sp. 2307UL5-6 TaxID=3384768 RepID=UPI0039BD445C